MSYHGSKIWTSLRGERWEDVGLGSVEASDGEKTYRIEINLLEFHLIVEQPNLFKDWSYHSTIEEVFAYLARPGMWETCSPETLEVLKTKLANELHADKQYTIPKTLEAVEHNAKRKKEFLNALVEYADANYVEPPVTDYWEEFYGEDD